ncbi:KH domain-containing protein [Candidatus Marinarcus aquaticus]|uniref:RNA-binding protein n=1 Tax=Candidatus Marinarcus aquaticus TaxID=2044504 RepID=A0A4Q0XNI3_9BACT|nr:KH domain-containing protein [Candidatus Marinarcus aquaticus]RXJ56241.1 RNA-binding protein [Candidatus Marinarcus aquaticus]
MITNFIENYAKLIVSFPEEITVTKEVIDDTFAEIVIHANSADIGKLIGKNGNMINAIKTMANGCKAKDGISYKIQVLANE